MARLGVRNASAYCAQLKDRNRHGQCECYYRNQELINTTSFPAVGHWGAADFHHEPAGPRGAGGGPSGPGSPAVTLDTDQAARVRSAFGFFDEDHDGVPTASELATLGRSVDLHTVEQDASGAAPDVGALPDQPNHLVQLAITDHPIPVY